MKNLKKYKYIGNEKEADEYVDPKPQRGCIYEEDITIGGMLVSYWTAGTDSVSDEWEEVVEEDSIQQAVCGSPEQDYYVGSNNYMNCTIVTTDVSGKEVNITFGSDDVDVFKKIFNNIF